MSEPGSGPSEASSGGSPALDPRAYQIGALSALLLYGSAALGFDLSAAHVGLLLGTALAAQLAWTVALRLPAFEGKSALISGLSLCLLLRTRSPLAAALAATAAISSKFLLRWHGKHVFNPTNFGIVAVLSATRSAWVSPSQWGSTAFLGFLLACLGGLVVQRAARADVTAAFLVPYAMLVAARSLWLGEPLEIPLHRLQAGALLIFSFFMISDPKTTPDRRAGRVLFGALVAAGAAYIQFRLYRNNGPVWSLALFSPLVPAIDAVLPGRRYAWRGRIPSPFQKGDPRETLPSPRALLPPVFGHEPSGARLLRLLRGEGRREAL